MVNSLFPGRERLVLLVALASWLLCSVALRAQSFSVQWESDSVGANEPAVLQLVFTDCGQVSPPALPPIANAITQYAGQSQNFTIVNGVQSSSVVHRYLVTPKAPGNVVIPALTVDVQGRKLTSKPSILKVGQGFDPAQVGTLSIEVPKTDVYVGESIPVGIRFQFKVAPARQEPPLLKMDGFVKGRQSGGEGHSEMINGETVSVARWTMAVTAVKAGELDLGPAEFQTLYVFQNRRRRNSPFDDPFFGQFFGGGGEQRQINFESPPVRLHVISPPTRGRPSQYNGAVGRFLIEVGANPTTVAAGDPITVRIKVSGSGNFDGLRLPEFDPDSGFQAYPGTNSFEASDVLGLEGAKTFEEVVVPERAGLKELKFPPLAYWDPVAKQYGLAEARSIPLNVRPNASTTVSGGPTAAALAGNSTPPAAPSNEMGPLKPDLGPLRDWTQPWFSRGWYYGGLVFPACCALAISVGRWWRRRPKDTSNSIRAIRLGKVEAALADVAQYASDGQPVECYAAAHAAIQEQLGILLGTTGGAYTEEIIESVLEPRGLGPDEASQLRDLFHSSARARFAGPVSSAELAKVPDQVESAIHTLRAMEGTP